MSKAISLKINDSVFKETEEMVKKMHMPRNLYINEAINHYNRLVKRSLLKKQYSEESRLLHTESLIVNRDLSQIDDGLPGD